MKLNKKYDANSAVSSRGCKSISKITDSKPTESHDNTTHINSNQISGNITSNGPLIYVKLHKVGGSAMTSAITKMGSDCAPWGKCPKFQLEKCGWYGKKHLTFKEIKLEGFDFFQIKYAGSIFALTMRDPGDRLLSMAEMRIGTSRPTEEEKMQGIHGHKNGTNQTALKIFENDVKENVDGNYTHYLAQLLGNQTYNFVCLLAHDGGFDKEECLDSPEHLTHKLPKAIESLKSFHVVGLNDDFGASVAMAGLTAGWDPVSILKHAQDGLDTPTPTTDIEFEESKKEIPERMCWDDIHKANKEMFQQSRLFWGEVRLFEEAQRIHSM